MEKQGDSILDLSDYANAVASLEKSFALYSAAEGGDYKEVIDVSIGR